MTDPKNQLDGSPQVGDLHAIPEGGKRMKLYRISTGAVCAVLALALVSPAVTAQDQDMPSSPSDRMMGQGGMMDGGMMEMMGQTMMGGGMMEMMMAEGMGMMGTGGPGPGMILRMGDALGLMGEQRAELEAIQAEYQETAAPIMSSMMHFHRDSAESLAGDSPDFDAYEDALREAADTMVEAHVAMARAASETQAVLTDEQRAQLQGRMQMMQGMMGQERSGMMMGPGGNR